jgi:hypothetical protein
MQIDQPLKGLSAREIGQSWSYVAPDAPLRFLEQAVKVRRYKLELATGASRQPENDRMLLSRCRRRFFFEDRVDDMFNGGSTVLLVE